MMVSTMGGAWAGILGAVTEFVLNTKNQMYNTNSGRSPALSIALAASFPLQVVNQVTPDGAVILWGAASRSGHDRPAPLALDPGGCAASLPCR